MRVCTRVWAYAYVYILLHDNIALSAIDSDLFSLQDLHRTFPGHSFFENVTAATASSTTVADHLLSDNPLETPRICKEAHTHAVYYYIIHAYTY